jgi:hypothetical protein
MGLHLAIVEQDRRALGYAEIAGGGAAGFGGMSVVVGWSSSGGLSLIDGRGTILGGVGAHCPGYSAVLR